MYPYWINAKAPIQKNRYITNIQNTIHQNLAETSRIMNIILENPEV